MESSNYTDMHATHPHSGRARGDRTRGEQATQRTRHQSARFRLEGISSSFDAARLERRLTRQVGVIGATVNPIVNCAYVAYDPALTTATILARQIELSGFQVTNR